MSLATRLSLVALVLAIGVGSAMLFRKQSPATGVSGATPDTLLLRKSPAATPPQPAVVRASEHGSSHTPPDVSVVRDAEDSAASGRRVLAPPDLENTFAQPLMPLRPHANNANGDLVELDTPERLPRTDSTASGPTDDEHGPRPPRIRIVVDGDSLQSLAKRYLGNSDRYMEIYEANRDVLDSPELLQIGMKLKIPRDQSTSAPSDIQSTDKKMVPIKK